MSSLYVKKFAEKLAKYKDMSFDKKIALTRKNCQKAYELSERLKNSNY